MDNNLLEISFFSLFKLSFLFMKLIGEELLSFSLDLLKESFDFKNFSFENFFNLLKLFEECDSQRKVKLNKSEEKINDRNRIRTIASTINSFRPSNVLYSKIFVKLNDIYINILKQHYFRMA